MKYLTLAEGKLSVSRIISGCMRIHEKNATEVEQLITDALEMGINHFDHADIYGGGKSETVFGEVLQQKPSLRAKMLLQIKCGISKGDRTIFDFGKDYIINAVEGSLRRLKTDNADILLLHRPDALIEMEEVAAAFRQLEEQGKVNYFGVSNMNTMQIALLQKFLPQRLLFNQLQFNPVNAGMIDQGLNVNMKNAESVNHDGSVLDYCRLQDITIQAWSMLQAEGTQKMFLGDPDYPELNAVLKKLAEQYQVTPAAVVAAWILRHPAGMQVITGTTSCAHLKDLCQAIDIVLTKREWYEVYLSVGKELP